MIAFASMLLAPAQEAGMKVPEDADDFDGAEYPHFQVYLNVQLGSSLPYPSAHWDNAQVIAELSEEKILTITFEELSPLLALGYPAP